MVKEKNIIQTAQQQKSPFIELHWLKIWQSKTPRYARQQIYLEKAQMH